MARRKLDMITMMIQAMESRKVLLTETRIEHFKILLSRAYNIMRGWYDYNCIKQKIENKNLIFKVSGACVFGLRGRNFKPSTEWT